jgi:hypothetical protein
MSIHSTRNGLIGRSSRALPAAFAVALLAGLPSDASAQGLFETLFGNTRPAISARAYAPVEPARPASPAATRTSLPVSTGRSTTFCVRLCDGRFFPMQHHGAAAAQTCNALCPASTTQTFSGGAITSAVATDGTRYSRLANAFLYRTRIVSDCTCNGKDSFGLAPLPISADPTMRPGDIVATGSVTAVKPTESKHSTRQVKTTFANR